MTITHRYRIIEGDLKYLRCPVCGKVMHRLHNSINYKCEHCLTKVNITILKFEMQWTTREK